MIAIKFRYTVNITNYDKDIQCTNEQGISSFFSAEHDELQFQTIDGEHSNSFSVHWKKLNIVLYLEQSSFNTTITYLLSWLTAKKRYVIYQSIQYEVVPIDDEIPINYIVGSTYTIQMQLITSTAIN